MTDRSPQIVGTGETDVGLRNFMMGTYRYMAAALATGTCRFVIQPMGIARICNCDSCPVWICRRQAAHDEPWRGSNVSIRICGLFRCLHVSRGHVHAWNGHR